MPSCGAISFCYEFVVWQFEFPDEFRNTLQHTVLNKFVKFNFDTEFVKLHFGAKRDRSISYHEFTQVLWVCLSV